MTNFRQQTLGQIKSATNDKEVESVIHNSLEILQTKKINGHIIKSYMTGMTISLLTIRNEGSSSGTKHNVAKAIEIFRKINRSN
jgi:hypothetical protein